MKSKIIGIITSFVLLLGMTFVATAPAATAAPSPDTRYVECAKTLQKHQSITMSKYLRAETTFYVQLCIEKKPKKDQQFWSRVTGVMYTYSYSRPGPSCRPPGGLNKVTFRAFISDTSGRNFNQPAVSIRCSERPVSTYRDYRKAGIFLRAFHHPKARVNIYADFAKPSKDVSDSMFVKLDPWGK